MHICKTCGIEYDRTSRVGQPGRLTDCETCADEQGDVQPYTGNRIFSHKTGMSLQINKNPELTRYINAATSLRNKGSNLGNNLKASSARPTRTEGDCAYTADAFSYKGKTE